MRKNSENFRTRSEPLAYITLDNWPSTPLAEFGQGFTGQDNPLSLGETTIEAELDQFFGHIASLLYSRRQELLHIEILSDEISEILNTVSSSEACKLLQMVGGCWSEGTIASEFNVIEGFRLLVRRLADRASALRRLSLMELNLIQDPINGSVIKEILSIEKKENSPRKSDTRDSILLAIRQKFNRGRVTDEVSWNRTMKELEGLSSLMRDNFGNKRADKVFADEITESDAWANLERLACGNGKLSEITAAYNELQSATERAANELCDRRDADAKSSAT